MGSLMGECILLPVGPGQIQAGPFACLERVGILSWGWMLVPQALVL